MSEPAAFGLPGKLSHRRIWSLTWPVIFANVTTPLVGVADVWVMGRMPDPAYIGAVAVGAAIFTALYWLFIFLRMGTTGLVSQAYGEHSRSPTAAADVVVAIMFFRSSGSFRLPIRVGGRRQT